MAKQAGCSRQYAHRCLRRWRQWGAIIVRRTGRASVYLLRHTPPWLVGVAVFFCAASDVNPSPHPSLPPHPPYSLRLFPPPVCSSSVRSCHRDLGAHIPAGPRSASSGQPGFGLQKPNTPIQIPNQKPKRRWHRLDGSVLADPIAFERALCRIERWVPHLRSYEGRVLAHVAAVYASRYSREYDPVGLWWYCVRKQPAHLWQHPVLLGRALRRLEYVKAVVSDDYFLEDDLEALEDSPALLRVVPVLMASPKWNEWWTNATGATRQPPLDIVCDLTHRALSRIVRWCRRRAYVRPTGGPWADATTSLTKLDTIDSIAKMPGFGEAMHTCGLAVMNDGVIEIREVVPNRPTMEVVSRLVPGPIWHVRLTPNQVLPIYQAYPAHRRGALGPFMHILEAGAWAVLAHQGDPDPGATLLKITQRYATSWAATHDCGIGALSPERFFAADGNWTCDPADWDQPGLQDAIAEGIERAERAERERKAAKQAEEERMQHAWDAFMRAHGVSPHTPSGVRHDTR